MTLERLDVVSITPMGDEVTALAGAPFEQVRAVATVALDPGRLENAFVVDLPLARRDPDGLVRARADVVLVRPFAGADGSTTGTRSRALLFAVANRGLVTGLPLSAGLPAFPPADGAIAAGDGWALRRGMSVAWVGWQWDVERGKGVVGMEAPEACDAEGRILRSQARLDFLPLVRQAHRRLADEAGPLMGPFRSLAADDVDEAHATLTVRDWFNGPREVVDRRRWRFARDVDGSPVADDEHVWLEGGFEPRRYYEVLYTTRCCPIAGFGLAAVRDVVAALRARLGVDRVLAYGASQSGRWLRQFVHDTANTDEEGRRVFDGMLCHIAGGRRGEFNNRAAQPSTMNPLGFTHLPPFSPDGGLFGPARARGNAPLTIFTNSATEYWRGDASLLHTDEAGVDLPEGEDWRAYLYAGTHHAAGLPEEYTAQLPVQLAPNRVEVLWAGRAHLAALDEWVSIGRPPPPSEVPRAADRSGVLREALLGRLAAHWRFAGVQLPDPAALPGMPPLDLGPGVASGVARYPAAVTGPFRPALVADIDEDGNEACGVRLPDVAVPLAASVGWNPETPRPDPRHRGRTHPVELWNLLGGAIDFAPQEILDRYGDRDSYLALVQRCIDELVARRHLLAEDAEVLLAASAARWDGLVGVPEERGTLR